MATHRIPMASGAENAATMQRTALDGRDYLLSFTWNQREERWYLSLADQSGDPIVSGLKLVVAWPLLRLVTDARRPPGQLVAVDTTATDGVGTDPGLDDLGSRVVLLYLDADELAATAAA